MTQAHMVCAAHAACRDHSVKLWCNDEQNGTTIYKPLETRSEHKVALVKMLRIRFCMGTSSSARDCARDNV